MSEKERKSLLTNKNLLLMLRLIESESDERLTLGVRGRRRDEGWER